MFARLTTAPSVISFVLTACLITSTFVSITYTQAANFFSGEKVYNTYCEGCHGVKGQGLIGGAPNFARGQGLMKPDASLYEIIDQGRNAMPSFRGVLKEEEYYDVISYIRSFY